MSKKQAVIIVAGGKGERMKSETPKQFLECAGLPVLMHTIKVFWEYNNEIDIVLTLPKQHIDYWNALVKQYRFSISHRIAEGGNTRFCSVKNALDLLDKDFGLVAIHDGVRPLVNVETIKNCFDTAEEKGNAIPVHNLSESIRKIEDNGSIALDRSNYKLVQTPQVFDTSILKESYKQPFSENFTDDASVVEAAGHKVYLVEGNVENIKITTPFDLTLATILLKENTI